MNIKLTLKAAAIATVAFFVTGGGIALADDVIRIASPYKTTTLDPVRSAAAGNIETFGQLYSRVFRRAADGSLAPGLAESWDVSADGKTITLNLRDAKFSDGSAITSEDVAFSLLRVRDHEKTAYGVTMKQMADAKPSGDHKVIVTLKNPSAPFLGNLEIFNIGIVSKKDVEARGEEVAFAKSPLTSGPYMVKEWLPGDRLILTANPNYWRVGYPKNAGVELIEIDDPNTRVSALLAGEIDAVRSVPWPQIAELQANSAVDVPLEPSTVIYMTLMNHSRPPFNNMKIRQAAAMALDTKSLAKAITFGHAPAANTTLPRLDFHHSGFSVNTYDPARAKALLAEAGGFDGEAVLLVRTSNADQQLATLIQAQWAAIGLKVKLEKVDAGVWWDRVPGADYDAAASWWYNETTDPDLAVGWALCGECGTKAFYTTYNNPKVDELMEAGATELDVTKREKIYHEIQEITTTEVSQIPLYYPPFANAYSKRISGLIMTPALQWTLEGATVN
jgi:peptide/nickel transport system substrate-binding protein